MTYNIVEALRKFEKNSQYKKSSGTYYVKNGSVGNGVLGTIDYLKKQGYKIQVVSESKFNSIKA